MSDRIKILGTFALVGFLAGMIANFAYKVAIPWLLEVFPLLLEWGGEWILSGLAGAFLTLLLLVMWAYMSAPQK
jgi:hypothetical protein